LIKSTDNYMYIYIK